MSCTCWRYSLAILQASKINFNVNITHFDKVMYIIRREIYLYRHIELYFIKVCTLCTLYYFIRNIWLNYILSKGNIWEIDCRITGDHCLKCEVILHSCVVTFILVHGQSLLELVPSGCIHLFLYCGTKLSSKNINWLCIRLIRMLCGGEFNYLMKVSSLNILSWLFYSWMFWLLFCASYGCNISLKYKMHIFAVSTTCRRLVSYSLIEHCLINCYSH